MSFFSFKRDRHLATDEPAAAQFDQLVAELASYRAAMGGEPPFKIFNLKDSFQSKYGDERQIGSVSTNPIPTNGLKGTIHYLNRLRTPQGDKFCYQRLGSLVDPQDRHPIDIFEVCSFQLDLRQVLFFDPYCSRRSRIPPDGLLLLGIDKLNRLEQALLSTPWLGAQTRIPGFPFSTLPFVLNEAANTGCPPEVRGIIEQLWNDSPSNMAIQANSPKLVAILSGDGLTIPSRGPDAQIIIFDDRHTSTIPYPDLLVALVEMVRNGRLCGLTKQVHDRVIQIEVRHGQSIGRGDLELIGDYLNQTNRHSYSGLSDFREVCRDQVFIEIKGV